MSAGRPRNWRRVAASVFLIGVIWPAMAVCGPLEEPTSNEGSRSGPVQSMPPGIRGQVLSQSGQPLHGVVVLPEALDQGSAPIPELAISTDRQGYFHWTLSPGRYRLRFFQDGRKVATRDVTVPEGRRAVTVNVTASAD